VTTPSPTERLLNALQHHDRRALEVAITAFPTPEAGQREATRLLEDMSLEIQVFWEGDSALHVYGPNKSAGNIRPSSRDALRDGYTPEL